MIPAELAAIAARALLPPLPGPVAQASMAPERRGIAVPGREPREAAVLVLLYPRASGSRDAKNRLAGIRRADEARNGGLAFPLILRGADLPSHAGQIGLPGGAVEPGEAPLDAALREAREEIGADPASIEILGALSQLFVPASGFIILPFVGFAGSRPDFRPEPGEVEEIAEAPLSALIDPAARRSEVRELGGSPGLAPYFAIAGLRVWGATAMILAEFAAALAAAGYPR